MTAPRPTRSSDEIAIDIAVRLGFLGLFAWLSISLIAPFAIVIAWAIILTVATKPAHIWLTNVLGGRSKIAAILVTLIGLIVVIGPTAVLAASLIGTVEHLTERLINGEMTLPGPVEHLLNWPVIGPGLHDLWTELSTNMSAFVKDYGKEIAGAGTVLLGSAVSLVGGLFAFGIAVLISGFLLVPGPMLVGRARAFATRVIGGRGDDLVDMAGLTIRNIAQGVIGISIVQALLIGVGLMVAQVPAAGLLALASAILGIIQIGPMFVVVPVIVWAWFTRDATTTALLALWLVPVGLSDNLIKPYLMSKGLRTPMLVILTGVIGGTIAYGLIGLFLGPIVLAVFYELLVAWVQAPSEREAEETDIGRPAE